jgi:hypothetical protein
MLDLVDPNLIWLIFLIIEGKETQTKNTGDMQSYIETQAEIGVMCLQAKGSQVLPAKPEVEKIMEWILF